MTGRKHFPPELAAVWKPLSLLGQGGMGQVFRCQHRNLGYFAAVKLTRLPKDPGLAKRTLREAETLQALRHPGVVRVYDGGVTEDGEAFLAMELLEGHTLERPPGPEDPFDFMLQVARALQVVHDSGIVHRDIKPSNLLLAKGERAVLLDFGLAFDAERSRITKTGSIAGTPSYLAPELLLGEDPAATSDWYAWGATLFKMVEGRLPYTWEQMREHVTGRGSLPQLDFHILEPGDSRRGLLEKALQLDAEERLESLRQIEDILDPISQELPVEAGHQVSRPPIPLPGPGSKPLPRWGWMSLFLAAILASFFWTGTSSAPDPDLGQESLQSAVRPKPLDPDRMAPTRERMGKLRAIVQELTGRHPQRDRLFSVAGHALEIPRLARTHVQEVFEGEDDRFPGDWDRLVKALSAWLVQLRDWEKDHPDARDPFSHPEIRLFLMEEVLPLTSHMIEDYLIAWLRSLDPRTALGRTGLILQTRPRLRAFLETNSSLFFLLDDWPELPRCLLSLRMLLPQDETLPGYPVAPLLARAREVLREPQDAQEYWLVASALLHTMAFAPWIRGTAWVERFIALENLDQTLSSKSLSLTEREQAMLWGRLMVEIGRLARSREKGGLDGLGAWYQRASRRMLKLAGSSPEIPVAALCSAQRMAIASEGVFYDDRELGDILDPWHSQVVVTPLEGMRQILPEDQKLAAGDLSPPFEASRWPRHNSR